MITSEQAINIAKKYAEKYKSGWDDDYHDTVKVNLNGEPVWLVSTSDIKYNEDLPWLIEQLPNPVYYYISMVNGICIAMGNRRNEIYVVKNEKP